MISSERVADLRSALEPIYKQFDDVRPWEKSWCVEWSRMALPLAQIALVGCGIELQERICAPNRQAASTYNIPQAYHHLLIDAAATDPLIVDGTYLQFGTGQYSGSVPHILITPASHSPRILDEADISPAIWFQWRPDLYGSDVFMTPKAWMAEGPDIILP